MPKLEFRGQRLEIRSFILKLFPNSSFSVPNTCGESAYNLQVSCVNVGGFVHRPGLKAKAWVDNQAEKTMVKAQAEQFLCTVYKQLVDNFTSVNAQLVHIFHIAYIKHQQIK